MISLPTFLRRSFRILTPIIILYFFLYSINLLGHSFKLFGVGFAEKLLQTTADPFLGLFIGIVTTSIIQASGATTAIIVGLVAAGTLSIENAIPMIMGANIGTTVTNLLVSLGHAGRRAEFQRAFSAAIVHDFFNVLTVIVFFPIELKFHIIQNAAVFLETGFAGIGGLTFFSPLKIMIDPVIHLTDGLFAQLPYAPIIMAVFSLILLFLSLTQMVRCIRSLMLGRVEVFIDRYLFGSDLASFLLGLILTAVVQSSSVTTSLIVPLAGAGIVTVRQIFPYTLGANIGTTLVSIVAALATGDAVAVTVAFCHLLFNVFGILVFYPLRIIPISLAVGVGEFIGKRDRNIVIVIACFCLFYLVPILIFVVKI